MNSKRRRTYQQTLAKVNIRVYNGSYTKMYAIKPINRTITGPNNYSYNSTTSAGGGSISVPYGKYHMEIASTEYHDACSSDLEVTGDCTWEVHLNAYYKINGSVTYSGEIEGNLANVNVYLCDSNDNVLEIVSTDDSGFYTSNNTYASGWSGKVKIYSVTKDGYTFSDASTSFTVTDEMGVACPQNISTTATVASKSVTFYVQKDGYTYQSSATKPTITVNSESQTVSPSGNTFSLPYGTYTVSIGSTNYNDAYSTSITVSDSSSSSYTYSVTGYYDLRVETKWYFGNSTSYSYTWSNSFITKLYLSGDTSNVLATVTSTTSGDAYFYVSGSYKVNGTSTYCISIPEQKLNDGACVSSSNNYVGLNYSNSDIKTNGHGGNQIYISYVLQLKTYTWQAIVNRDDSSFSYSGISVSITNSSDSSLSYSATTTAGVATFNSLPWGKYNVSIGSSTYSLSLTSTCNDFDLTYSTFSTTFNVTGKYGVKFEVVGSNGSYIGNAACELYDSSGSYLTSGTTNSGGDVTFNHDYTLTYGAYFYVIVPSQVTSEYNITGKTFYLYANTSYGSKSNINYSTFYDFLYFRSNTVTVSAVSPQKVTRSLPLTSNNVITETNQSYTISNSSLSSYSLSISSSGGGYVNSGTNHLTIFKWPLGGKVKWSSYDWSLTFRCAAKSVTYLYPFVTLNSNYTESHNVGVRLGSNTSSSLNGYGKVGFNVSYNNQPTLLIDNTQSSKWTKYNNGTWSSSDGSATITINYYASSGKLDWSASGSSGTNISQIYIYPSLSDDTSDSYLAIMLSYYMSIYSIILTCYIE